MLKRVITSIVALCVLIPILLLSNTWVLPIAVAFCCFIANYEMLKCIGLVSRIELSMPLLAVSVVAPIFARSINSLDKFYIAFSCVVFAIILYIMAVAVFSKGRVGVEDISVSAIMSFYVTIGFVSIVLLHDLFTMGHYTYLLIFIGAWITDIFAYFCGRLFGKHKLIPEVSPKKTVEGSIGGTIFAGLSFVLFGFVLNSIEISIEFGYIQLFVFGIIAAVVAQIGDLSMSVIKRRYGIKDFGNIFPGHGGMLDRFDSVLAVAIVLLIMNTIVSNL